MHVNQDHDARHLIVQQLISLSLDQDRIVLHSGAQKRGLSVQFHDPASATSDT